MTFPIILDSNGQRIKARSAIVLKHTDTPSEIKCKFAAATKLYSAADHNWRVKTLELCADVTDLATSRGGIEDSLLPLVVRYVVLGDENPKEIKVIALRPVLLYDKDRVLAIYEIADGWLYIDRRDGQWEPKQEQKQPRERRKRTLQGYLPVPSPSKTA